MKKGLQKPLTQNYTFRKVLRDTIQQLKSTFVHVAVTGHTN